MKGRNRKILRTLLLTFIIFLSIDTSALAHHDNRTILIVTDQLDFSIIEELEIDNEMSLGMINTRTANVFNNSSESYFMTIATGRRVELEEGLFQGIRVDDQEKLVVDGYEDIIHGLNESYTDFSKEMEFLADTLMDHGVHVGYIGNGVSSLIAADKNGVIHHGHPNMKYNLDWLIDKTEDTMKESDLLVISYDIANEKSRLQVLEEYINQYSTYNIMIFPSEVSGDVADIRNSALVPFVYYTPRQVSGMLSSDSTNREGIITNMDIFSELADIYNIELNTDTGHEIYSIGNQESKEELIEKNKNHLNGILNFIVIKYIFHGIVIVTQLYIIYDICKRKRKNYPRYSLLINGIIISIFLSILLGVFDLSQSIFLYCTLIILLSMGVALWMKRKKVYSNILFSIGTNILLLIAVYFRPNMIYYSFFGFNNAVSGGRFYGLNNESMGILLVTSIITFFWIKGKIKNKVASTIVLIVYFPIIILALSGSYATNFGGYLTSIALFVMLLYTTAFNKKLNKKNLLILIIIGVIVFLISFMAELNSSPNGHAKSLLFRIEALGIYELINMVTKKIKQLALTAISPPWNIAFLSQMYFIRKFILNEKRIISKVKEEDPKKIIELLVIFISSILVFALNDTGVTAFVYMNTYLLKELIYLRQRYGQY